MDEIKKLVDQVIEESPKPLDLSEKRKEKERRLKKQIMEKILESAKKFDW